MKGAAISTPITDRVGHRSAIAKVSAPVPQPASSNSPDSGNSTKSRNTLASRLDHRPSQNSYAAPSLAWKFDDCDDMITWSCAELQGLPAATEAFSPVDMSCTWQ